MIPAAPFTRARPSKSKALKTSQSQNLCIIRTLDLHQLPKTQALPIFGNLYGKLNVNYQFKKEELAENRMFNNDILAEFYHLLDKVDKIAKGKRSSSKISLIHHFVPYSLRSHQSY